jgi:hypothetical protein
MLRLSCDRHGEQGVDHRKGDAGHHADLPIRQVKVAFDRLGQDIDHLAVQTVEHIDAEKQAERITSEGVTVGSGRFVGGGSRIGRVKISWHASQGIIDALGLTP